MTAANSPRLSLAALIAVKPGHRPRLIYRTHPGRRRRPGGRKGLTEADYAALLDAGPAAWGWADQCWTLARIAAVVHERFGVDYTLAGLDLLLHRLGWSVQVPARRAAERDEDQITAWREASWPEIKGRRRTWAPGESSKTSPARA